MFNKTVLINISDSGIFTTFRKVGRIEISENVVTLFTEDLINAVFLKEDIDFFQVRETAVKEEEDKDAELQPAR